MTGGKNENPPNIEGLLYLTLKFLYLSFCELNIPNFYLKRAADFFILNAEYLLLLPALFRDLQVYQFPYIYTLKRQPQT